MRIAMVSEHASPLAVLGGADAGGQNVHVAALSAALTRRGVEVVVHTRRDDPDLPQRVLAVPGVRSVADLDQERLHGEMARRRLYLHPVRWTSLGLSLLEAMHLGMPVVALATTEVVEAVPPEAGVISTRVEVLADTARRLVADPEQARLMGKAARAAATARYGLERFLGDWDALLEEVVSG